MGPQNGSIWGRAAVPAALLGLAIVTLAGCSSPQPTPTPVPPTPTAVAHLVITVGDIDPDEPTKKIKRFTPLAEYLATHLSEFGIREGRVRIARDIREMGRFLADGTVDLFF